jgi:hypothetical protein
MSALAMANNADIKRGKNMLSLTIKDGDTIKIASGMRPIWETCDNPPVIIDLDLLQ